MEDEEWLLSEQCEHTGPKSRNYFLKTLKLTQFVVTNFIIITLYS